METEKVKKNIDYSNSAVNLTNPPQLRDALSRLHNAISRVNDLQAKIDVAIPPELSIAKSAECAIIDMLHADIRAWIEAYGSYQDVEKGVYALKQRKVSVSYNAVAFEAYYPQYAPAIIIKAIDTVKLKGLIKGGLMTEEELLTGHAPPVAKENENFTYIIK